MRRHLVLVLLAACGAWAAPAAPETKDPFAPVRFLLGSWSGTASGESGAGRVAREYRLVLDGHFIHERNDTLYPAQDQNPAGEAHEHWSFFSYDRDRERLVLRQLHEEGFVNTYALDAAQSRPSRVVFTSTDFENFDDAWRARETYEILSPDEFVESFELAPPERPFALYSRSHLRRASP